MLVMPIPDQFIAGALTLLKIEQEAFDSLMAQLNSQQARAGLQRFAETIAVSFGSGTPLAQIIDFLLFLGYQRQVLGDPVSIADYATIIQRSLSTRGVVGTPEQWTRFTSVITEFLSAKGSLGLSFKANLLLTQNERNFAQINILSDVRTVFDEETVEHPIAAVIVHVLKIAYLEAGTRKEFFVGLDDGELEEMKLAIDRAQKKSKVLRQMVANAGVTCLVENEEGGI